MKAEKTTIQFFFFFWRDIMSLFFQKFMVQPVEEQYWLLMLLLLLLFLLFKCRKKKQTKKNLSISIQCLLWTFQLATWLVSWPTNKNHKCIEENFWNDNDDGKNSKKMKLTFIDDWKVTQFFSLLQLLIIFNFFFYSFYSCRFCFPLLL